MKYLNMEQGPRHGLLARLDGEQASVNTKEHAVYAYFFLGFTLARIAKVYRKGKATISRWVDRFEKTGSLSRRKSVGSNAKFTQEQRQWVLQYIMNHPLSFLDETRQAFMMYWNIGISISSVGRLLREANLTYKVSANLLALRIDTYQ